MIVSVKILQVWIVYTAASNAFAEGRRLTKFVVLDS